MVVVGVGVPVCYTDADPRHGDVWGRLRRRFERDIPVTNRTAALSGCACPHGRPVVIEISEDELNERFERDYPGHPGHRSG